MMNIFPPSGPVRVGDIANVPFYCSEPGTVDFTSSDPTVATVASTLVVPGTRVWRNGLKHGQYLARANCLQARTNCAWFLELQAEHLANSYNGVANTFSALTVIENINTASLNRVNWGFQALSLKNAANTQYFAINFLYSLNDTSNVAVVGGTVKQIGSWPVTSRTIVTYDGTNIRIYSTTGTGADSTVAGNLNNTMGGTEAIIIKFPCKFAKMEGSLPSQAQREAFQSAGTLPAGLAASYQGGHEINPAAPVFYDTSGNALDLSDVDVQYWPEAAASGDFTDDPLDPVMPYQAIAVNALKTGTTTITARRRRQGIPYRTPELPDAEVYEDTTYLLTVTDALVSEQSTVQLMIYADRDGTATISMDNPIIDFPASVSVVLGKNQISGLVTGAGTCNVTVEMNGVSDVTTFIIEAIGTWIKAGPAQDYQVYLP